ncbi:MAG TPA: hypothetical protein PLJ27_11860 [Polyangiaceae bacterium]|jgi:hypothetical protein|nr:MAG: hypothetical protein BWY17_04344 [Deltaproteobacteria bacterium ADurb.Bin207]HNS98132.1 hypothetical protein [Polyangiaceae bacterium]HNZ25055.1 hypothetical protein [Polyangiaceae bacterium]HOD24409.1 hypothetical protein [Polyangiaceae bacterium]HOE49949.1 hypothetical protein [Polyangiaceae bacterium]
MALDSDETNKESNDATVALLREIRDIQKESLDWQRRFLWILIPIFAVLVVQATLLLFR